MSAPSSLVDRLRQVLEAVPAVRVAWLFGSQASGLARPDSDLDIAVLLDPRLDVWGREEARRDIVESLTRALGALGERADVSDVERVATPVAFRAIRDGVRLLARDERERLEAEVRIARRWDDERPWRERLRRAARGGST